jgi:glycosyltransferase involved in cell wall biosynthesis
MPPHILFLNRTAHTLGGAATWLDYIEPGLRDCGWRVTVGLLEGKQFHRPERYLEKHPHQEWLRIACTTGTAEGRREALREGIRSVKPDLIISLNVADALAVIADWRSSGQLTPRIAVSAQMIDEGLLQDIAAFSDMLDAVICTNALTRQLAIKLGGMPSERVCYGPYGVAIPELGLPTDTAVPAQRLHLFYVGRIDWPDKRIHDLVPILDELEARAVPFTLAVIGSGPDEAEFRRRMQVRIQDGSVQLIGRLAPEMIWPRIHAAGGVLLLTSWTDTGPFVVFEAMAWHVPVVSSQYYGSGLERALRHTQTAMLFPIGDAPAAADCLRQIWTDRALHRRLIDNAAQLVHNWYSLEKSIAEWDRVFRSLLEMPLRTGSLEQVRRLVPEHSGLSAQPSENDEWPLSIARVGPGNSEFWAYVAELDAD